MRNRTILQLVIPLGVALLSAPISANASVIFSIDDSTDNVAIVGTSPFGFDPATLNVQLVGEALDVHGEYLSSLNLANGAIVTVNFNFLESATTPNIFSDTLNLVFTGHTPTALDPNNISVDAHFRSDVDPNSVPGLANAITLTETGQFQALGTMIAQNGGPTDFQVSVRSDVIPEPVSLLLVGTALLLGGVVRRRKTGTPE